MTIDIDTIQRGQHVIVSAPGNALETYRGLTGTVRSVFIAGSESYVIVQFDNGELEHKTVPFGQLELDIA